MKILIIDGQGGRVGRMLVEQLKRTEPALSLIAIGTNSIATATMLKAGADEGATGENPVIYNSADADIIIGPIGIIVANSLLGEITSSMSTAIASSAAKKVLIPVNKCNSTVVGVQNMSLSEYINLAVENVRSYIHSETL
jgi:hypothetical protein